MRASKEAKRGVDGKCVEFALQLGSASRCDSRFCAGPLACVCVCVWDAAVQMRARVDVRARVCVTEAAGFRTQNTAGSPCRRFSLDDFFAVWRVELAKVSSEIIHRVQIYFACLSLSLHHLFQII